MLKKISEKHEQLVQLTSLFELETEICLVTENDHHLISDFKNTFDEIMTDVLKIESSLVVEYPETKFTSHLNDYTESLEFKHLKLKQQLSEDPYGDLLKNKGKKQDWKTFNIKDSLCSFSKWTEYLKTFSKKLISTKNKIISLRNKLSLIRSKRHNKISLAITKNNSKKYLLNSYRKSSN